jgi:hypothetical protein
MCRKRLSLALLVAAFTLILGTMDAQARGYRGFRGYSTRDYGSVDYGTINYVPRGYGTINYVPRGYGTIGYVPRGYGGIGIYGYGIRRY